MLEEALNNPNGSPSETARALLSFFGQEFHLGGTATEARFVHFFPSLLVRIFGPVIANSLSREHEFTAEEMKLIGSAWLMYARPWNSSSSNTGTRSGSSPSIPYSPYNYSSSSAPKLESDPVIQLLSAPQHLADKSPSSSTMQSELIQQSSGKAISFFQIMTCQADLDLHILRNAQSAFPFMELPSSMQRAIVSLVQMQSESIVDETSVTVPGSLVSSGARKLLDCLVVNPLQQKEFVHRMKVISSRSFGNERHFASNGNPGSTRSVSINMNSNIQSPILSTGNMLNQPYSPTPTSAKDMDAVDVNVMIRKLHLDLSLCEYYLMVFARFPLLLGKMYQVKKNSSSSQGSRSRSGSSVYGEKVYYHLLRNYINYHFPHEFDDTEIVQFPSTPPAENSDPHAGKNSIKEFFVRIMIEYWFEKHIYSSTKDALMNLSLDSVGLESSYDLAQLLPVRGGNMWNSNDFTRIQTNQIYEAPSKHVQRGIRTLIEHLICDPAIARQCRDFIKRKQVVSKRFSAERCIWSIPQIQTTMQPSLYNYIRTALRYGPIHVSRSSFYVAMDLWLMWLEPWNVQRKKMAGATMQAKELFHNVTHMSSPSGSSTSSRRRVQQCSTYVIPTSSQNSKYTDDWQPYVAANLHFYLVPLAIFLRRARELDFTRGDFQRSMNHVQKVIRIFSPKLVETIDGLLGGQEGCDELRMLVERHEKVLAEFSPSREVRGEKQWSLKMLQEEMHNLLEEITLQHQKSVVEQDLLERLYSKIEVVFLPNAEEVVISKLVEKAKAIFKFPKGYEVVSNTKRRTGLFGKSINEDVTSGTSNYSPERKSNGFITEKGREQILHGARMCNAIDVNFLGDPMYARPKSHEIEFLVQWSLYLSNRLNVYFNLDSSDQNKLIIERTSTTVEQLAKEGEQIKERGLSRFFRFNLRFFADTRNWILIFVVYVVIRTKLV